MDDVADNPPNYTTLLQQLHRQLLPRTYLEIGVHRGRSFALTAPGTLRVGVDPAPEVEFPPDPLTKIFPCTSDDFFADHGRQDVFDGRAVDMVFVDGMHLFEFALRDFMNAERLCHRNSLILFHDCYPIDEATASRDREMSARTGRKAWSGDVWKLIVCLKENRPDLRITAVDVRPTGLGLITGLDPSSTRLRDRYDQLVDRFVPMDYSVVRDNKAAVLNRIPNDWHVIQGLLPTPYRTVKAPGMSVRIYRKVRRQLRSSRVGPSKRH
jgi:hypothetical protein